MNRFVIAEPQNCIGCRTCEVACAMAHSSAHGAEPLNPDNFMPRLSVVKNESVSTVALCRHCEDAPCANACPSGAIVYRNDSVQVIQERCVGCKSCMVACPYGAMRIVSVPAPQTGLIKSRATRAQALKCDLCENREQGPACVAACPTHALQLVDAARMEAALKQRQLLAAQGMPNVTL